MNRLAAACVLLLMFASPSSALDIGVCGVSVPPGERGTLVSDLSCFNGLGVRLGPTASLDMNGHEINGAGTGVLCEHRSCAILGPGRITGTSSCGVQPQNGSGPIRIYLSGIDIDNTACPVAGSRAKDISLRLQDVNVTDNATGLSAGRIKAVNLTATGNGVAGLDGRRYVRLIDSTITANDGIGVIARTGVTLRNTTVSGNDPVNGFDVASHLKPHLHDATCDHSVVIPDPFALPDAGSPTWGVCSGD